MRQDTGVVEQFLAIDGRVAQVAKAEEEELQRSPLIGGDQCAEWIHGASPRRRSDVSPDSWIRQLVVALQMIGISAQPQVDNQTHVSYICLPMRRRIVFALLLLAAVASVAYVSLRRPTTLVLTGIVTTNDVIVSPQIDGRLAQLRSSKATASTRDQVIAVIDPRELAADSAYYSSSEAGAGAQVREAQAALHYQEHQTTDAIAQAASMLASAKSQQAEAAAALENARVELDAHAAVVRAGHRVDAADGSGAHGVRRRACARRCAGAAGGGAAGGAGAGAGERAAGRLFGEPAAVERAHAAGGRRAAVEGRRAARYTEVRSPIDGIVDVRAARPGEVVNRGQPIVTVINPDDLWVRVDVEETYIDRVRIGDQLQVRLPSGDLRDGTVFYRGADAPLPPNAT